jgi:RHS repeat-associated protein
MIAAVVLNPRIAVAVQTLFWALCSAAFASVFLANALRTARNRGLIGRLRARLAWRLADAGWLRPAAAAALAAGGGGLSTYERRRRRLLWPAPIMACVMLAFGLQCGGGSGSNAPMLMLAPGNALFASDQDLGPGKNGYGYAEVGTFFFQQDQVGSTSLVTDDGGKVVANTIYKPYGEVYQDGSEGRDIYRRKFNGNEWDRDGGMYYFNARYYDPGLGSFLQADDLLFGTEGDHAATLNRYAFSVNNPVTFSDPGGNFVPFGIMLIGLARMMTTVAGAFGSAMGSAGSTLSAGIASAWAAAPTMASVWSGLSTVLWSYTFQYAAIYGGLYAYEASQKGEAFDAGKFFTAAALGAVGGAVAGGVLGAVKFAGTLASLRAASGLSGTVASTIWKAASYAATGLSWIASGAAGTCISSALTQLALNGYVDTGKLANSTLYFGAIGGFGFGLAAAAGSRYGSYIIANIMKRLPEIGGAVLVTAGVGGSIGVVTHLTLQESTR